MAETEISGGLVVNGEAWLLVMAESSDREIESSDRKVTEQSWMFERFLTQSDSLAGRGLSQLRLFEFTQEEHRISKNITPPGKKFFKTSQEL